MPDCQLRGAAGKIIVMATLKIKLLQSFLAAPAFGRCILWILTLNPTHKFVIKICIFSTGTEILRAGPPSPLCFLFFVFSHPPTTSNTQGRPLTERSKTLRPDRVWSLSGGEFVRSYPIYLACSHPTPFALLITATDHTGSVPRAWTLAAGTGELLQTLQCRSYLHTAETTRAQLRCAYSTAVWLLSTPLKRCKSLLHGPADRRGFISRPWRFSGAQW